MMLSVPPEVMFPVPDSGPFMRSIAMAMTSVSIFLRLGKAARPNAFSDW